jgi:hypothetical protein
MNKKLSIILVIVLLAVLYSLQSDAQVGKFQAGYIYQFTKYIEWPATYKSGDFVIGILGNADVSSSLQELASTKKVVDQAIKVQDYASVGDVGKCNILFIAASQSGDLDAVLKKLWTSGTMIICEKPGMAQSGASINFLEKDGKLVFEINQSSFDRHGLSVNSQLLNLAVKKY